MITPWRATATASLWRNRDFRRFIAGQFVTNAGDSVYAVAVLWTVHDLVGSPVVTGVVNGILLLPWLLQILAGPVVDRLPLGPVLVGTQVVQGGAVLFLAHAAATGPVGVPILVAAVAVATLGSVLLSPVSTTVVPRIVDDERLSNANAALATVTLGLDMVFDAVGGVAVAVAGTATLFLVDAVTFAVAACLFARVAIPATDRDSSWADPESTSAAATYLADLRAGIAALRGSAFVDIVALTAVVNLATGVTLATLPAFADTLGGPTLYGLLLGALGVGRLAGSLLAPRLEEVPYGRLTVVSYGLATGCWLGAAVVPSPPLAVVLFCLAWVAPGVDSVLTPTLNQRVFPDELLARVSSIKGTAAGATLPVGSVLGGLVARDVGPTATVALAAGGVAVVSAGFLLRRRLRRLPAVADATAGDFDVDPRSDRGES